MEILKDKPIVALVPCRAGSQRVKDKNIRDFAGESLIKIKLKQLLKVPEVSRIIVSTDDPKVKDIVNNLNEDKIEISHEELDRSDIGSNNESMVRYFANKFDIDGHFLWTHVTSPFITEETYSKAIKLYLENLGKNDSLVSVIKIQKYLWDENGHSFNYDHSAEKWPKTQTLKPIYEINSGIFLLPYSLMREKQDRIGDKPIYFETTKLENFDIDWQEDFDLALMLWTSIQNRKS